MQHFKEVTTGLPIILGRKTWESLPQKPLKNKFMKKGIFKGD
ncbi:MAG: dihydrofolate reductase [Verrucomicrobiota bacterium]